MWLLFWRATLSKKIWFEITTLLIPCLFFINKALFNFMKHLSKHLSNYGKVPLGQFDTWILTFLIVSCYIKCFWLIALGVLIFKWKVLFSPGIHVTSIYLLIGIVISVIWRDKSILWACKNKDYFLHSCSIFLNFKLFIQSIILEHTSVEKFNHVNTFLLILCSF